MTDFPAFNYPQTICRDRHGRSMFSGYGTVGGVYAAFDGDKGVQLINQRRLQWQTDLSYKAFAPAVPLLSHNKGKVSFLACCYNATKGFTEGKPCKKRLWPCDSNRFFGIKKTMLRGAARLVKQEGLTLVLCRTC